VPQQVNFVHWLCCCGGALQEEEAMLSEMEVTGQAFEDMQEQNVRLLQQLREKDDANFKLMSEVRACVHSAAIGSFSSITTMQHAVNMPLNCMYLYCYCELIVQQKPKSLGFF